MGVFKGVKLSAKAFEKMKNLRVLKIDELEISGDLELLSKELRWLSWRNCPLKYIPSSFPAKRLVVLDMSGSNIQEFHVNLQGCGSLTELNLSRCKCLRRTPNFKGSSSLRYLSFRDCSTLSKIHQSIGNLDKLIYLDFSNCKRLRKLPRSMCLLKSLESLDISDCSSLQRLSFDPVDLPSLKTLSASRTGIKQWPTSVGRPTLVRKLQLNLFKVDIPSDIGNLSSLEWLDLSGIIFNRLPFDFSKLLRLRDLRLNNCPNLHTLPSVSNLEYLRNFEVRDCRRLVRIEELHNLPSISRIDMVGTYSLQNPFNEGFFSAHALALKSREDRNLVKKPELHIFFQCRIIPNWCSNRVRAPSICFTMPTHNKEYKFLGMVLWFVRDYPFKPFSHSWRLGFSFSIAGKMPAGTSWPMCIPRDKNRHISYVFYKSSLETPFDGQMKGGEKIEVVEKSCAKKSMMQIGVHLLYLDQHGRVLSLPAVVDEGRDNLQPPKVNQGMKEFITGFGVYED